VKPRRPIDSLTSAVEDIAGSLRRRRQSRELKIVVHGADGKVRTIDPASEEAEPILDAADQLLSPPAAPTP
jgi:hypothetical protein